MHYREEEKTKSSHHTWVGMHRTCVAMHREASYKATTHSKVRRWLATISPILRQAQYSMLSPTSYGIWGSERARSGAAAS